MNARAIGKLDILLHVPAAWQSHIQSLREGEDGLAASSIQDTLKDTPTRIWLLGA